MAEIERAVRDLGLRGITIMAQVQGLPLDAPALAPFYRTACELDVPIFVHPSLLPAGDARIGQYDLARIIGREVDLQVAVARLIAGRVRCAIEGIRSDRLVFATDYPQDFAAAAGQEGKGVDAIQDYVAMIRGLPLLDGAAPAILGETAARLLRLDH